MSDYDRKQTVISQTVQVTAANPFLVIMPQGEDVVITSVEFAVTADATIACHQLDLAGLPGGGTPANVNSAAGKLKTQAPVTATKSHSTTGTTTLLWEGKYKAAEGSREKCIVMGLNAAKTDTVARGICFIASGTFPFDVTFTVTVDTDLSLNG